MIGSYAVSPDGRRIAYERCGVGRPVILLHGGGGCRQDWQTAGYVERLQERFTVITMDLRGHGESDLPTDPADYAIEKLVEDIMAVADACGVERFDLWGMSYGGKVGRYAAVQAERLERMIMMGTPLGPGVMGQSRQMAIDFCAHWPPIVQALREGNLDLAALSQDDQATWQRINVPIVMAWARAMLDWPTVGPTDFRCPTLWLVGSEDQEAMESFRLYEQAFRGSRLQVERLEGLDHMQVFEEIERVLPMMIAFSLQT